VGSTVLEKPVQVTLDPAASVTSGALETQYQRTTSLRDLRSSVNDALRGLDSLKSQIEERRKALETQKKEIPESLKTGFDSRLEELNGILDRLARPSGKPFWSEGPRLSERLQDLFGQLNGTLVAPTAAQSEYLEELRAEYREKMAEVNRFFGEAATAMSRLLEENGAPGLLVPPAIELVE
jgi:DNA repair exonuclease SbcCD ATPase subunit